MVIAVVDNLFLSAIRTLMSHVDRFVTVWRF